MRSLLVPLGDGQRCRHEYKELIGKGVEILACRTCLGRFEIKDSLAVGQVSNMYDIAEALLAAGRVIRI